MILLGFEPGIEMVTKGPDQKNHYFGNWCCELLGHVHFASIFQYRIGVQEHDKERASPPKVQVFEFGFGLYTKRSRNGETKSSSFIKLRYTYMRLVLVRSSPV
ncbi:hypothetical protein Droror1_Dr00017523 [Drosera rotundifolia]